MLSCITHHHIRRPLHPMLARKLLALAPSPILGLALAPSRSFGVVDNFRRRFRALAAEDDKLQELQDKVPEFLKPKDPKVEEDKTKTKKSIFNLFKTETEKEAPKFSTKHHQSSPTDDGYVFFAGMKPTPSTQELSRMEEVNAKLEEQRKIREMEAAADFDFEAFDPTADPAADPPTQSEAESARSHPHFGALVFVEDAPKKIWGSPLSMYESIREACINYGISLSTRTSLMLGDINIMYPDFHIVRFLNELEKFHQYHIIAEANGDIEFYKKYATEEMVQILEHQFQEREEKGEVLENYVIGVTRSEMYGLDYIEEDLAIHVTFEAYHTNKRLNKEGQIIDGNEKMQHVRYLSIWRMCLDKPRLAGVHRISMELVY